MKNRVFISKGLLMGVALIFGSCLNNDSISYYQQLQEDIAEIDEYLAAHPPEDPSHLLLRDHYSGIRMVITELGTGTIPPTPQNTIEVAYKLKRLTGGDTTQTMETDDSFVFTLDPNDGDQQDVITGWKFALTMMTEGTKATVFIPSGLAYGTRSVGGMPKNSILVYEMYLRTVDTSDQQPKLANDMNQIALRLIDEPNAVHDPSGISYILQPLGAGPSPGLYDQVHIKYSAKLFNGQPAIDLVERSPRADFSSFLSNYPHALILGLKNMHPGDKATIYSPSALAFGPNSNDPIPPNSILIFEVELVDVKPFGQ